MSCDSFMLFVAISLGMFAKFFAYTAVGYIVGVIFTDNEEVVMGYFVFLLVPQIVLFWGSHLLMVLLNFAPYTPCSPFFAELYQTPNTGFYGFCDKVINWIEYPALLAVRFIKRLFF
jgi:hypothetical protein